MDKYKDAAIYAEDAGKVIDECRRDQTLMEAAGSVEHNLLTSDVLWARARLQNGKTNGGCSTLVPENIELLPLPSIYLLIRLFRVRIQGQTREVMRSWHNILLSFLEKVRNPSRMLQFRGVCLLDTFGKLFMSCLVTMFKRQPVPVQWKENMNFADEPCTSMCRI